VVGDPQRDTVQEGRAVTGVEVDEGTGRAAPAYGEGARVARRGVPSWLLPPVAIVALSVGLWAGPTMPWADDRPATTSAEAGFARDMAAHHEQAVEMSLVAMRRTQDPAVRSLATDVVLTQTSQIGTMLGWLEEWGLPVSDGPLERMTWMGHELEADGRMPGMATEEEVRGLEQLSGAAFDRAYLSLLHVHHVGGIPMADSLVGATDLAHVASLARSIRDSQSAELGTLETMLATLGAAVPDGGTGHGESHGG
jgi:uncharacterized protein (DUF305 family)